MSDLTDLLFKRMTELQIDQDELAKLVGLSQPAISKIMSGKTKRPRVLPDLAVALKIDVNALYKAVGIKGVSLEIPSARTVGVDPLAPNTADLNEYALIHQYQDISLSAGYGNHAPEYEESNGRMAFKRRWLETKGYKEKDLKAVYADGDSMNPRIQNGDVLLIDTSKKTFKSGTICAINYNGMALVKRLTRRMDGSILVQSDNKDKNIYPDDTIEDDSDELVIIGRVVWVGGDV